MRRILAILLLATLAASVAVPALAAPSTGITSTSSASITWDGTYTARFTRSASGIINESSRVNSAGAQNPWTSADVYLQFRPLTGPSGSGDPIPNPNCDPNGLVTPAFTYVNSVAALAGTTTSGYFIGSNPYRVCVYLVNPVVATGSVNSAVMAGTTATLPTGLSGRFRINISGTYANSTLNLADAEYTGIPDWLNQQDGYNVDPYFLGAGFGDVQVDGAFVNWGAYTASHAYSYTLTTSGSINLAVFDGDSNTNTKEASWYGDNVGTLSYTITYLGL